MKKVLKLFTAALVIAAVVCMAALAVSAEESARRVDPATLAPTGERVIFIKDAPEGGTLEGDGTGYDANNPYNPMDHEDFDPSAAAPMNHLQTAFYQATEILAEDGGTIVICGPVHLGLYESHGSGGTTKDVFTAKWGSKAVIKFTSVYNGVDYRETAGAKITIETPAEITVLGSSIWENIDIETIGTDRVISFSSHPTLVGEGVNTYPKDEAFIEVASNYVSLAGGHRYAKGTDQIPTLTVQSGTYNKITGGLWGVVTNGGMENATSYLTLEGTTRVLGFISGTVGKNSTYSGHVNITINGGNYECDLYGVGSTGLTNTDGTVDIVINGGDFTRAWSINAAAASATNNPPAYSLLDLSGYQGDKTALAYVYSNVTEFSEVRLPSSVTEDELIKICAELGEVEETEAPAAETTAESEKQDEKTEKPEATEKPDDENVEPTEQTVPGSESNTLMITLIIVIIVAVVAIAGLAVVIIVMLKKKTK